MSEPTVTVLLPVHNGARYLRHAIDGILRQDFGDFELLVIDDGSTDQTPEILATVRDPRLVVHRQDRGGLTRALIRGLDLAQGRYVARQDADDQSLRGRLRRQIEYLQAHPEVAMIGTGILLVDEDGRAIREYRYPADHERLVEALMGIVNPLPHTTIMFRRDVVREVGGYRDVFLKAQDYDLCLRLIERHRLASIPEPLCALRHVGSSLTFQDQEGLQFEYAVLGLVSSAVRRAAGVDPLDGLGRGEFLRVFREWYRSSAYPRRFHSRRYRRIARLLWAQGRRGESLVAFFRALGADPVWPMRWLGFRPPHAEGAQALQWAQRWTAGLVREGTAGSGA